MTSPSVDPADGLLPFSIDFWRGEVELFDPADYMSRETPPFAASFVRGTGRGMFATDLDEYLDCYESDAREYAERETFHVFMVNRCGSTLLLNALTRLSGLVGFDELDPWPLTAEPDIAGLVERVDRALGAHFRSWSVAQGRRLLFKHRGEMLLAAPRMLANFPRSRAVFLVRHHDDVIGSQLAGPPSSFPGGVVRDIERMSASVWSWQPGLRAELYAAFYLDTIARYRALAASELAGSVRCLRYETFVAAPEAALHALSTFFGLPAEPRDIEAACAELRYDAKASGAGRREAFVASARRAVELPEPIREALARAWSEPLPNELQLA